MSKWIEGKLKDLVEINPTVKLKKGEIYPFVSMDVIQPFYKPVEAKEEREFKSGGAKFENGDTLFARITPCLENGKIAQVKNLKNGKGFGSTEFIVLRGKEGITDTDFVYYLVTNKSFRENAERLMVGTSGRQRVDKQQFEDQIISIPDLETQKRISSILGSIDRKIELNVEMNKTLEEMAMTLYKHWFVDFGPFQDGEFVESELGMIPKEWKTKKIGNLENVTVVDYVANGSFATLKKNVKILDDVNYALFIRNTDLKNGFTTKKYIDKHAYEFLSKTKLFGGEVLISNVADVGSVYLCPKLNCKMSLGNNMIMINSSNLNYYLYLLFKSDYGQHLIDSITGGSAQRKFNKTDFRALTILIPDEIQLERFNKIVYKLFESINNNNIEIDYLVSIREYLLPRLLSGEIDVSKAEKQVEEVL
ncbi:UNVERIFIED_ORG: type I restriction enzyme S subunit [Anoxybacillus amylolyticus]